MDFLPDKNLGNWLKALNGKTVEKIYQLDFNKDRELDIHLPWMFLIIFKDLDKFLEIEGDFDGDHIRINLYENSELDRKLKVSDLPNEPDLWSIYDTKQDETLGQLLGRDIESIEFGIDKDEFEIKGYLIKGQKDVFKFIRFNCKNLSITIFDGSATGLGVSDDLNVKLNFEDTFERYDTKDKNNP